MKRLSPVLGALDDGSVSFFCAACGHSHNLPVHGQYTGTHDAWSWDGNVEAPVFTPSVRAWYPRRGRRSAPTRADSGSSDLERARRPCPPA